MDVRYLDLAMSRPKATGRYDEAGFAEEIEVQHVFSGKALMSEQLVRSPLLLSRERSLLLIVDAQQRLLPLSRNADTVRWNLRRLAEGARLLEVPTLGTEQYPERLGATIEELQPYLLDVPGKMSFSCGGCTEFVAQLDALTVTQIVVAGIETHVCVLQTVFDLLAAGFDVFVVVDAVSARHQIDHDTALRRMEMAGATLITVESTLFEWCVVSGTDVFRQISQLVRESENRRP